MIFPNFRDSEIPIIDRPFFSILRSSLWQTPVDTSAWPEVVDWEPIIAAFEAHALLGVVAHTILSLPKERGVSSPQLQDRILTYVGQVMKQRHKTRKIICDIFTLLEKSNLHPILLKGEGLASLYPNTCHRSVGDIDFYLPPQEYQQGCDLVKTICTIDSAHEAKQIDYHFHLYYGDIEIEIHQTPGCAANRRYEPQYQTLAQQWMTWETTDIININNTPIHIPSPYNNMQYVFNHLCDHYVSTGIGIRQFIDVTLIAQSLTPTQLATLPADFKTVGNLKAWNQLSCFMNQYLGTNIPTTTKQTSTAILNYLLRNGNFGKYKPYSDDVETTNILNQLKKRLFCVTPILRLYPSELMYRCTNYIKRGIGYQK